MNIHDINQVSNPCLFSEVCHMAVKVNLKWLRSPPPFGSADSGSLYILSSCEVVWWGGGWWDLCNGRQCPPQLRSRSSRSESNSGRN